MIPKVLELPKTGSVPHCSWFSRKIIEIPKYYAEKAQSTIWCRTRLHKVRAHNQLRPTVQKIQYLRPGTPRFHSEIKGNDIKPLPKRNIIEMHRNCLPNTVRLSVPSVKVSAQRCSSPRESALFDCP